VEKKQCWGKKKNNLKKQFLRFYAKTVADTGSRGAADNKKLELFQNVLVNFFILITSASNLVGCCRTQM